MWRAVDVRLERPVAIKVLPADFAADRERVSRFAREAKLLASLRHPGIATIHSFEEVEGQRLLVMELAEGEGLDERIRRGPIPLEDAIPIARQIAEALEHAHEQGVVHRDLKPANVRVTGDGRVKLLDFGLAKAMLAEAPGPSGPALSMSPTLEASPTVAGVILGTAPYMAPEQARGKAVDRRADIWAFGAVLWEMLVGKRLFTGESVSDVLANVLKQPINLEALPRGPSVSLQRLLLRCLERDSKKRLCDIGEARIALEDVGAEEIDPAAARQAPRTSRAWVTAIAATAAGLGALAAWLLHPTPPPPAMRSVSFPVESLSVSSPSPPVLSSRTTVRASSTSPTGRCACNRSPIRSPLRSMEVEVEVRRGANLSLSAPRRLFSLSEHRLQTGASFDVASDGRFPMVRQGEPPRIVVVNGVRLLERDGR